MGHKRTHRRVWGRGGVLGSKTEREGDVMAFGAF